MTYTSAWSSKKGIINYKSDDGSEIIREGGTRSWRNNNPGNIESGSFSRKCGSIGTDGRFAIFPSEDVGLSAIGKLLLTTSYKELTLEKAIYQYAPSSENDSKAYAEAVSKQTGISLDAVIGKLSDDERGKIASAIQVHEGWKVGNEHPKTSPKFASLMEDVDFKIAETSITPQQSSAEQLSAVVSQFISSISQTGNIQDGSQPRLFFPEGIELIEVKIQGALGDPKAPSITASLTVSGLKTATNPTPTPPDTPKPKQQLSMVSSLDEHLFADEFDEVSSNLALTDLQKFAFPSPKPIPENHPFSFAKSRVPVSERHWPVITSNPQRNEISYQTIDGRIIGNKYRMFLGERNGGARYHVAIDIYAENNDEVIACEDGKIVAFYSFYPSRIGEMTFALLVEHNDFVINYGEVKGSSPQLYKWRVGDSVRGGQRLARVSSTGMTHFETYMKGTTRNERWMKNSPQPAHLLNPTLYLLEIMNA